MRTWLRTVAKSYEGGPALLLAGRAVQLVNGLLLSGILVHCFGLAVVGSFAIGLAAVNILAVVCPLGLGNHLPRLRHDHGQLCFAGLALPVAQLPVVVPLLFLYAVLQAHDADELRVIFYVSLSGFFIGLYNMGLMLAIVRRRFYVGLGGPLCETAGMVIGSVAAATPAQFALAVLLSRVASSALVWAGFRYERVPPARLLRIARASLHYVLTDTLTVLPEQAAPLLLAGVVGRDELGLFRLCQQLLMAADTPVWTFVQSRYPRMVDGDAGLLAELGQQVTRLAWVSSALCLAGSTVLALVFFRTPIVALLMAVIAPSLRWRYRAYLYGQALRATGRLAEVTALSTTRLCLALAVFWAAAHAFGLWGAVAALTAMSVVTGTAYEWTCRHGVPAWAVNVTRRLEPAALAD